MIRLDTTNRTLVISIVGSVITNPIQILVGYSDDTGTTYTGGTEISTMSSGGATICSSPASSTIRNIDSITVFNKDTVSNAVSISFNDTGTTYQLINVVLQTGETLQYTHGRGWESTDINGAIKSSLISQYASNLTGTPTLPNGTSAVTQTALNSSNYLATTAYVDGAISSYSVSHTTIYQITADFGIQPSNNGSFTITGSGFTPGNAVNIWQASTRPNSSYYDSIEMDQISITGIVINSTTIQCNWGCSTKVANSYTFNYRF
jgi:hypothetical protein